MPSSKSFSPKQFQKEIHHLHKCASSTEKIEVLDGFAAVIQMEHKKLAIKPVKSKKKLKPTIESSLSSSDSERSVNYMQCHIVQKRLKKSINVNRIITVESSDDDV